MNKKKILYIGEPSNVFMLINYHLTKKGYEVYFWNDIEKEYNFIEFDIEPDLILIETKVNNKYFFEICSKIRKSPKLCSVPILVLSEISYIEKIDEYFLSGVNGFLMLPFKLEDLFRSLKVLER